MRQMSIGFTVPKARDKWNDDMTERTIKELQLFEASVVWQGANPYTSSSMRSFDEMLASLTDAEMTDDELRAELERRAATSNPAAAVDVVAASVEPGSDADPLEALTKAELAVKLDERQIAKPQGVTDWDKLKKPDLIALLKG
jgi:hypothetical protein